MFNLFQLPIGERVTGNAVGLNGFHALVEQERREMIRLAALLTDSPDRAEEVVQEAFASVSVRWERLEHPETYLRAAVISGSMAVQDRKSELPPVFWLSETGSAGLPPNLVELRNALNAVSDQQRRVVVLRHYLVLPVDEIAEVLQLEPSTVRSLAYPGLGGHPGGGDTNGTPRPVPATSHLDRLRRDPAVEVLADENRLQRELPLLADALADADSNPVFEVALTFDHAPAAVGAGRGSTTEPTSVGAGRHWITAMSSMAAALLIALAGIGVWVSIDDNEPEPADLPERAATDNGGPTEVGRPADAATPVGFGTWTSTADVPIADRSFAASYWNGAEAVFWAGSNLDRSLAFTDGAAYDPDTDRWRVVNGPGWGHPGLSAAYLDGQLYVVAKGGASVVDLETGQSRDLPAINDDTGPFLLMAAVASGEVVYFAGGWHDGTEVVGLAIVRYDPVDDSMEVVYRQSASVINWVDATSSPVEMIWTGEDVMLWDASGTGVAYRPESGDGRRLRPLRTSYGTVTDSRLIMTDRGPVAVARIVDSGALTVRLARLAGHGWAWSRSSLAVEDFSTATVVAADDWLVMVSAHEAPVVWHLPSGRWSRDPNGPSATGANAVWTGDGVVVWGQNAGSGRRRETAMIWTPPPASKGELDGPGSADGSPAVFDLRFDAGDRFRLALPASLADERFEVVFEPTDHSPGVVESRSLRVTVDYAQCRRTRSDVNVLGSHVHIEEQRLVICRPDNTLTSIVRWRDPFASPTESELDFQAFDIRPMALGPTYRQALAKARPELVDCEQCHLPFGPYVGEGEAVVTVSGRRVVEATHPTLPRSLWSFDPGGLGTTLHHLPGSVGVAVDGGDFLSVDAWVGTVRWGIERDPNEAATLVTTGLGRGSGFGLLRTSFTAESDGRRPLVRRFDSLSGSVAWTAAGPPDTAWLAIDPVVVGVEGESINRQVVVLVAVADDNGASPTAAAVIGLDATTGRQLWIHDLDPVGDSIEVVVDEQSNAQRPSTVLIRTNSATVAALDPTTGLLRSD